MCIGGPDAFCCVVYATLSSLIWSLRLLNAPHLNWCAFLPAFESGMASEHTSHILTCAWAKASGPISLRASAECRVLMWMHNWEPIRADGVYGHNGQCLTCSPSWARASCCDKSPRVLRICLCGGGGFGSGGCDCLVPRCGELTVVLFVCPVSIDAATVFGFVSALALVEDFGCRCCCGCSSSANNCSGCSKLAAIPCE